MPSVKQERLARAAIIDRTLESLYPDVRVPLDHRDPYTLLVAVLLSAQCTDARVNQVTPHLFARAADPAAMVRLPVSDIAAIIRPCGLAPAKSKAIHGLSVLLLERHGGQVPADFAALEALPGVGHKTASVVMAQAFGQRWKLTSGKNVVQTEVDLKALFPEARWNKLHIQIILYGREHCTARGCDGTTCLLCRTLFPGRTRPVTTRK